jgi:ATP-dependent Clp protease ATP-binding subunit ClpC
MYDRFTDATRRVITLATEQADDLAHQYIGTEHILLGLTREHNSAAKVLSEFKADHLWVYARMLTQILAAQPAT